MSRILHVIPAVAPRYGGPSVATVGLCRALDAAGLSTVVATTDADGPGRLEVPIGKVHPWQSVNTIFFRRSLSEGFKWSASLAAWLRAHVNDFDAVHIHAVFSHSSVAAGRACRRASVPYLVRPLGTLDPWSLTRRRIEKRLLLRGSVGRLLEGAAAIHYTTAEEMRLAATAVRTLPAGIVVPLGIDDAVFADAGGVAPHIRDSNPYVLSLSRLDDKKGVDLLIRAFHAAVHRGLPDPWRLVIAGDGDHAFVSRLKDLAMQGDGRGRIEFRGWVSGPEKARLFGEASVFALPSHQENFGISVAEAMAAAVPVIVTPGVNLAQAIETAGAGWVVERDLDQLSEQLWTSMSSADERIERGRRARALAEDFRWPRVVASLRAVYDRLTLERSTKYEVRSTKLKVGSGKVPPF